MTDTLPTHDMADIGNLVWELHHAPGATLDLIAQIVSYDFADSLHEYELTISASCGLQLSAPYLDADCRDTVRIPLPEHKTVGDLIAALFACPLPALILHALRTTKHGGEGSWITEPDAFDDAIEKFLYALEHWDGSALQHWLKAVFEEATSEPQHTLEA